MRSLLGVTAAVAALLAIPAAPAAELSPLATQAKLGFALLEGLAAPGNLTVSPASLAGALAAIAPGADPAMQAAIGKTIGYGPEETAAALAALRAVAAELGDAAPDSGPLAFANAVFVAPGSGLLPSGYELLDGAGVETRELAIGTEAGIAELNGWVAERTAGLIPEILAAPLQGAVLAAVNALHFKDTWRYAFPADATAPGPFQQVDGPATDVALMHLPATSLEVRESDRFIGVSLPFADSRFALTVVTTRDAAAPLGAFAPVADWLAGEGFTSAMAALTLPKFTAESASDLLPVAEALGLAEGYSPDAFAALAPELAISAIIQKTVIKVDEAGAEAAAATVITMERSVSAAPPPVPVVVDRPFLFSLRDVSRGLVLVMGYVASP